MSHFIYDLDTHRTVAVVRADLEHPDMAIPSSEDPVSIRMQWESIMAGHQLKVYPLPSSSQPQNDTLEAPYHAA